MVPLWFQLTRIQPRYRRCRRSPPFGISLADLAAAEARSFHRAARGRVYLVECNRIEAQQYARDLAQMLGVAVEGTLIGGCGRS